MATPYPELRERLLRAGVAPRHVRRYLAELGDHLSDLRAEGERAGLGGAEARSAALARMGSAEDLAGAMTRERRFQAWCVRAPWAVFGVGPPLVLALGYLAACPILWSGWLLFLPGNATPFVPVDGLAVVYFGVGRMLYFGAPVLVGWGMGLLAARQRMTLAWPALGCALVAVLGAAARVHAGRPEMAGGAGRISMDLRLGSSAGEISHSLFQAAVLLSLALLPCLAWRRMKAPRATA